MVCRNLMRDSGGGLGVNLPPNDVLHEPRDANQVTVTLDHFGEDQVQQAGSNGPEAALGRKEFIALVKASNISASVGKRSWAALVLNSPTGTVSRAEVDKEIRLLRQAPHYTWFKYACCGSWLLCIIALAAACSSLVAMRTIAKLGERLCGDPLVLLFLNQSAYRDQPPTGSVSCSELFTPYARCVSDGVTLVSSSVMRGCFIDVTVDDEPALSGSSSPLLLARQVRDLSYRLAASLAGPSLVLDASRAREILTQERDQEQLYSGGGRQLRGGSTIDWLLRDKVAIGQRPELRQLSEIPSTAPLTLANTTIAPPPPPGWTGLPISEQLDQAYAGIAAASLVALLCGGGGDAAAIYSRCVFGSILLLLPALLALRSLGNRPSRYCCVPRHPEAMRKVGMRCRRVLRNLALKAVASPTRQLWRRGHAWTSAQGCGSDVA